MNFDNIYKDVITSFGSLWDIKHRGDTLEIITPFATTSHKFISVFLSKRNNEFIVSDGGWLFDGMYENSFDRKINCYNKIFIHYQNTFNIKEVKNQSGTIYFYKKTDKEISVPSLVLDMSNFISSLVSLSNVEYADKELEVEKGFNRQAKEYLTQIIPNKDIEFNEYFDRKKEVKVNAIIKKRNGKIVLVNYITGGDYFYFRGNIYKTHFLFELADSSLEKSYIQKKVALIDNTANGYNLEKINIALNHLGKNTQSQQIIWTNKQELQEL
jgi:hypothetical protein